MKPIIRKLGKVSITPQGDYNSLYNHLLNKIEH